MGCGGRLDEGAHERVDARPDRRDRQQDKPELIRIHRGTAGSHRPAAKAAPHGHTVGVEAAFLWVMLAVVAIGVIVAVAMLFTGESNYDRIGRGAFSLDTPDRPVTGPAPGSAAAEAEARAEIRQLVEAKSARREARGEAPLDIEAEIDALTHPGGGGGGTAADADPQLREEVRQLVIARNERRARQGQEPLDVEAEVDRQLRELGGG